MTKYNLEIKSKKKKKNEYVSIDKVLFFFVLFKLLEKGETKKKRDKRLKKFIGKVLLVRNRKHSDLYFGLVLDILHKLSTDHVCFRHNISFE